MTELQEINTRLKRIERMLSASARPNKTWISAHRVTALTYWDANRMKQARRDGGIEYKISKGGGYLYLLESIPQVFIKQTTHS